MKAAYIENGVVLAGEMPDPVPGKGQALVRTHSCGMCASEQHFLHSGQNVIDLSRQFSRDHIECRQFFGQVFTRMDSSQCHIDAPSGSQQFPRSMGPAHDQPIRSKSATDH